MHTTDNFDEVNFSEFYIKSSDKMNFDKWLDSALIRLYKGAYFGVHLLAKVRANSP